MVSFEGLIEHNKRLSILLFFLLLLLLGGLGASVGVWWGGEWYTGLLVASAVAVIYFLISWYAGASMILSMSGAREIRHEDAPQLWNVVEELSIAAGLPMPKVYMLEDGAMNAFATGRDPQHAGVAITRGLMEKLNREELQAVMAHEMSHVRNYDIRFAMLMAVMVGSIVLICDVVLRRVFYGRRRRSRSSDGGQGQGGLAGGALGTPAPGPLLDPLSPPAVCRPAPLGRPPRPGPSRRASRAGPWRGRSRRVPVLLPAVPGAGFQRAPEIYPAR